MIPCLTKKKQILKSVLRAGHRPELKYVRLVDDRSSPYPDFFNIERNYFKARTFEIGVDTRDDVMAALFDISLTNFMVVGIHRRNKTLEICLYETNYYKNTNIDADVVNWISLLFKPSWKSIMEIASPLEIYYKIGSERKWFSYEEGIRLFELLLLGEGNHQW